MNNEGLESNQNRQQEKEKESSGQPEEIISLDVGREGETTPGLDEETTLSLLQDAQEEKYEEAIGQYADDEAIQDALIDRQDLNTGQEELLSELEEHHAKSPTLSGGDIDAAWEDANVGEETAGGMAPTPDQDRVDEIGEAYGIHYEDDEPLRTAEKLAERDEERWELDPEATEEENSA